MPISVEQVQQVARLARIALTPQERQRFTAQLDRVLEYVQQLQRLDTSHVEPAFHVLPIVNVTRDDQRGPSLPVDAVTALAPDRQGPFLRVPLVVDEGA